MVAGDLHLLHSLRALWVHAVGVHESREADFGAKWLCGDD